MVQGPNFMVQLVLKEATCWKVFDVGYMSISGGALHGVGILPSTIETGGMYVRSVVC